MAKHKPLPKDFAKHMDDVLNNRKKKYPKSKHKLIKSDEDVIQIETDWDASEAPI